MVHDQMINALLLHFRVPVSIRGHGMMLTGYYLTIDRACRAFECHPSAGSGCKSCRALEHRTARGQCSACNDGYFLDDELIRLLQQGF